MILASLVIRDLYRRCGGEEAGQDAEAGDGEAARDGEKGEEAG
jgi:hypothetical protein